MRKTPFRVANETPTRPDQRMGWARCYGNDTIYILFYFSFICADKNRRLARANQMLTPAITDPQNINKTLAPELSPGHSAGGPYWVIIIGHLTSPARTTLPPSSEETFRRFSSFKWVQCKSMERRTRTPSSDGHVY